MNTYSQTLKKVTKLALPMAGSRLISMLSNFISVIMLSILGPKILAATNVINSAQITITVIGFSILFAISFVVGNAYGAKKYHRIGGIVQQGWLLSFIISIPVILLYYFIGPILTLAGQNPQIVTMAVGFFHVLIFAVIPLMWCVTSQQFCFAIKKQMLVIKVNIFSTIIFVGFAYLFIFGKFGLPAMGIKGYALANVIQVCFSASVYILIFSRHQDFKHFKLFTFRLKKTGYLLAKIFQVGWPMSMQFGGELLSFLVLTLMVGWIGVNALAAQQIVGQYMFLFLVPMFAISEAAGILVSQARGAKDYQAIAKTTMTIAALGLVIMLIIGVCFIVFPHQLATLYLHQKDATNTAILILVVQLFIIIAVSQTFDALRAIISGALRGLYDTKFPMQVGIAGVWFIAIPLAYFLAFPLKLGVIGVALGSLIGIFVATVAVILRWRYKINNLEGHLDLP